MPGGSGASAYESPAPAAEATAPTTESTPEPTTPSTESTVTPESTSSTEKMAMAVIGGKLTELGIKLDSDQGKDILKQLSENPDLVDGFGEKLDKAKTDGAKFMEFAKGLGYPLSEAAATKLTLDLIISGLGTDVAKLTETSGSDSTSSEDIQKKNKLLMILKALGVALAVVALAPVTAPLAAGLAGGALAAGALGKH